MGVPTLLLTSGVDWQTKDMNFSFGTKVLQIQKVSGPGTQDVRLLCSFGRGQPMFVTPTFTLTSSHCPVGAELSFRVRTGKDMFGIFREFQDFQEIQGFASRISAIPAGILGNSGMMRVLLHVKGCGGDRYRV